MQGYVSGVRASPLTASNAGGGLRAYAIAPCCARSAIDARSGVRCADVLGSGWMPEFSVMSRNIF